MKKFLTLILTVGIAMMLAACGGDDAEENQQEDEELAEQANEELEVTEEEKVDDEDVVVNINDEDIKGKYYNVIYKQTKMQMHQFGEDASDLDAVKEHTLDELIAQELVMQDAEEQGIDVSDEEVQTELDDFKKENEEGLQDYLSEFELTEESFKDQILFSLVLNKYIQEEIEIDEVTEEETKEMYDGLKEQNEEIAGYEELKEDIKQSLENQKKQERLQAKIDELKQSADIEKLI